MFWNGATRNHTLPWIHFLFTLPIAPSLKNQEKVLIDKMIYELTSPKRYDVVVFENEDADKVYWGGHGTADNSFIFAHVNRKKQCDNHNDQF